MNSDYYMRQALWEIVILFVFVHFPFHFLLWSMGYTFITIKKKGRKEVRRVKRKERERLALLCQDIWLLDSSFA